ENDLVNTPAGQIMRLERIASDWQTCFHSCNAVVDNETHRDFAQPHSNHFAETDRRVCDSRPDPETKKIEKDDREHECEQGQYCDADKIKRIHILRRYRKRHTAQSSKSANTTADES